MVSQLCLLLKQESGAALPPFPNTIEGISEICMAETGIRPERISPVNEYDVVLQYPNTTIPSRVAMTLYKVEKWCGFLLLLIVH